MTDPYSAPSILADRGAAADFDSREQQWRAAATGAVIADASALSAITFEGPDAATFLQGQLSNDVDALAPGQGQWTTYNSPKGRMLATLFLVRSSQAGGYTALLARDLAEAVRKRLAMFVLRAKVTLRAADGGDVFLGVGGPGAKDAVVDAFGHAPAAGSTAAHGATVVVHLPDGRFVVTAPHADAAVVSAALARRATPAGVAIWSWLGVRSGVPMITAATQDQFVAQAANWDALRGIDFRKGCYTGQEIVARTQHLGRLKERLYAFRTDGDPPPPGTRMYSRVFGEQASGTVVNSAPDASGGARFLAVAQVAAADSESMNVGAPDGPTAQREPLPYELPAPAAPRERLRS